MTSWGFLSLFPTGAPPRASRSYTVAGFFVFVFFPPAPGAISSLAGRHVTSPGQDDGHLIGW